MEKIKKEINKRTKDLTLDTLEKESKIIYKLRNDLIKRCLEESWNTEEIASCIGIPKLWVDERIKHDRLSTTTFYSIESENKFKKNLILRLEKMIKKLSEEVIKDDI
jgi:hypothetical protein